MESLIIYSQYRPRLQEPNKYILPSNTIYLTELLKFNFWVACQPTIGSIGIGLSTAGIDQYLECRIGIGIDPAVPSLACACGPAESCRMPPPPPPAEGIMHGLTAECLLLLLPLQKASCMVSLLQLQNPLLLLQCIDEHLMQRSPVTHNQAFTLLVRPCLVDSLDGGATDVPILYEPTVQVAQVGSKKEHFLIPID